MIIVSEELEKEVKFFILSKKKNSIRILGDYKIEFKLIDKRSGQWINPKKKRCI